MLELPTGSHLLAKVSCSQLWLSLVKCDPSWYFFPPVQNVRCTPPPKPRVCPGAEVCGLGGDLCSWLSPAAWLMEGTLSHSKLGVQVLRSSLQKW